MFDKFKRIILQFLVLTINAALVTGGALSIRSQQQKKQADQDLASNAGINEAQQAIAEQAEQLQQIVEQNRNQKSEIIASNPDVVTVQKPTTVTQTIPAKTKTIKVPASSSKSSSTSSKTTKTS